MTRHIIFAIVFWMISATTYCQITFEKTYGGLEMDFGYTVEQTNDEGYILVGSTESFGVDLRDIFIIKTDKYGDTLWTRTCGDEGFDYGRDLVQTSDGGYVFIGSKNTETIILKIDPDGQALWTHSFGGTCVSIDKTLDSGFVLAGDIWLGSSNYDMYLIKTDNKGDTLWTKMYGGEESDRCQDVKSTSDGGYILIGSTRAGSEYDVYLIKVDFEGNEEWTSTFGGSGYETGNTVEQTEDGGYIIVGSLDKYNDKKLQLIKTDSNGEKVWSKIYDHGNTNDEDYDVKQLADGGYVFIAETVAQELDYKQVHLVRTNSLGDTSWTRTFRQGFGNGIEITEDGGFVIIGFTASMGAGMNDIYLIKTDSLGRLDPNLNTIHNSGVSIKAYPNPFVDKTTIKLSNSNHQYHTIELYDNKGQRVRTIEKLEGVTLELEKGNLPSGVYFLKLVGQNKVEATCKLVIK